MGLSERRVKQRIGNDPRNLTWADNAAKFGHAYLSKLGWNPSKGLGVSGEGRTSHIVATQKLNMLGIGANPASGSDAIAWKQNKDFESVLERLNQVQVDKEEVEQEEKVASLDSDDKGQKASKGSDRKSKKKDKRKAESASASSLQSPEDTSSDSADTPDTEATKLPKPQRMAHRAKFHASKRLAKSSPAALAEVLGHSASASPAPTPATPTSGSLTPITDKPSEDDGVIKTSTVSVADYFKQKMLAKLGQKSGSITMASSPLSLSPVLPEDGDDRPRIGLGAKASVSQKCSSDDLDETQVPSRMEETKKRSKRDKDDGTRESSIDGITETIKEKKKKKKRKMDDVDDDVGVDNAGSEKKKKKRRKERS
ncbi:hypothetical protein FRC03_006453 [Tulasnella sp. 419]|nr:hypothetical protein FRC03_006453 [Tulasnella sp. 419]